MKNSLLVIALIFIIFNVSCKKSTNSEVRDDDDIVWSDATHGVLTDTRDNEEYNVIIIGEKVWMAENLKVTQYRNGDKIPNAMDYNFTTDTYCSHFNDNSNINTYGLLYNWYAVDDSRGLAPAGWHIPSDEEWKHLETYLGMSQTAADSTGYRGTDEGSKLKSTNGWYNNGNGTNESGFTALPGGYRGSYNGTFSIIGGLAYFWSSTEREEFTAWSRKLDSNNSNVDRLWGMKRSCFSVRCVRD